MAASMCMRTATSMRGSKLLQHIYLRLQKDAVLNLHHEALIAQRTTRHILTNPRCLQWRSFSTSAEQLGNERAEVSVSEDSLVLQERPKGYLAWKPVDDVYLRQHYPPQPKSFDEAMEILRKQDKWMFCRLQNKYADRTITISINLDMALQKKKKVDPFQNMLILPHAFKPDNKVLCFARGTDAQVAQDAGADIIGGEELVPKVLSKEVRDFDFCVSSPDMMAELASLKRQLRKRFPNSKRGSVGPDLASMIHRYKKGQDYKCQVRGKHVNVSIGKLSLTNEQIEENMQCIITDICKHKPLEFGPFITKLTINAFLLDGILIKFDKYLPVPVDELDSLQLKPTQDKAAL
ncbi:39S ribosomal protein L1, mitochondrial-like [Patiria miniata]|uniref:Mitochondrial ribosomal protein L1 n=1 Tax=Patiria miniata TaxID=46514 RepID=A0A914AEW4_PATMI|nr:39S ribosomal protein L1, mitochondrial-like [Patiria miniata]